MPNELNLKALAKYWEAKGLKMTWRHYYQLVKDGKVPEPSTGGAAKGSVDALEALCKIAVYYQRMAQGDGGDASLTDERKRKTTAEADMAEMERDEMACALIRREDVAGELVRRVVVLKTDLLAMPKRLAKWPEAKQICEKVILAILKTYSQKKGVFRK